MPCLRFTQLTEVLAAAAAGAGIAMGWQMLLGDMLQTGALARVGSTEIVPEMDHNLVVAQSRKSSWQAELVERWLAQELAAG